VPKCQGCVGGALVPPRLSASFAAQAAYLRARQRQTDEELSALQEGRKSRLVARARLEVDEGPVAALRALAPGDLCAVCHHELEQVRKGLRWRSIAHRCLALPFYWVNGQCQLPGFVAMRVQGQLSDMLCVVG
jgi:hypothetical protein